MPKTGERSTRSFTLREASNRTNSQYETEPLLGYDGSLAEEFSVELTRIEYIKKKCRRQGLRALHFLTSRAGKAILKCSIAYALGSMATLVPGISRLYGQRQDSKHLVATVAVYFHPARTIGSMHEATILAAIAVAYAAFISFTSMALSMFLGANGLLTLGHAVVLIVFVGGGLGAIALVKQRMGNPLVNVAASLAALGCITVLIKEGSVQAGKFSHQKVLQILSMVVTGVVIATVVNFLLFPILARRRLSRDMEQTTDQLGEMLVCITRAFLRGSEEDLSSDFYKRLRDGHQVSMNTMKKNLGEAKMEFYAIGKERLYAVNARLVSCLAGLSADLGGLRSAAYAQFSFIDQKAPTAATGPTSFADLTSYATTPSSEPEQQSALDSIVESEEDEAGLPNGKLPSDVYRGLRTLKSLPKLAKHVSTDESTEGVLRRSATDASIADAADLYSSAVLTRSPGDMFIAFISRLGPPTKSLVYTIKQILDELPFRDKADSTSRWNPWVHRSIEVAVNEQLHSSLRLAIEMYRESRKAALAELHQSRAMNAALNAQQGEKSKFGQRNVMSSTQSDGRTSPTTPFKSSFYRRQDEILADIEEVSACCGHFSFSLLDFAEDVLVYLDILHELKNAMENETYSWRWLLFWTSHPTKTGPNIEPAGVQPQTLENALESNVTPQSAKERNTPSAARQKEPWYVAVHRALRVFRRDDVVFAAKVGIGAILYAYPAFREDLRPTFVHWRGEWGLVTYMLVCCSTIGASNTTGINRFLGTAIGSLLAVLAWVISSNHGEANPVLLGVLGFIVSFPCFYINISKNNGPFCRFILLTYNLGALYSYSLSIRDDDDDDDEGGIDPAIWDIVLHRFVSVVAGIIWGLFISRVVWPVKARQKLKEGLSILWLRMSLIFKRDPLMTLLLGSPSSHYMDIREEAELHSFLTTLKVLCKAASHEFELQGPFPEDVFTRVLSRTSRMLDAFHALNVVIRKNLQFTPGEAAVLRYTRGERTALSARISHLFTVLASSIKLEYPISDVLPDIENSRDKLLAGISEYRRSGTGRELTTEQDFELLYAYVLVTGQLAKDIQAVVPDIETLYGTLNEDNLKLE